VTTDQTNQTGQTRLHFSRFEFKYVLPRALRDDVEAELGHFVELDPYVVGQSHQQYFVRSLYFDDPDYGCFRQKVDGVHTRSTFRIRTYARDVDARAPWFLEIKGRYNNLVFKHRTPFLGDFDRRARGYDLCRLTLARTEPGSVQNQFEFELYRRQIRPLVLVDYERRPYLSRFDPEFRLTFDSNLHACAADSMFPPSGAVMRAMLPGYTVMEVKFRHHVPAWFHRIIQAYELRRVSISKICTGTQVLGLQLDPN
jgi:hypothetical protein